MKKVVSIILALALMLLLALSVSASEKAEYFVNTTADNIVIDGVIDEGEWGDILFTTTPDACLAKAKDGWNFWSFVPAPVGQHFDLYVTNDASYVYVAGQLVGAEKDMSCTDVANMWEHPHMTFTLAIYDKGLVCPVIEYQGDNYEQYACYAIGFVNGSPAHGCTSQGMDTHELKSDMYSCSYNEATKTYIYECKIPMTYTNLNLLDTDLCVMGIDVTDAALEGQSGNRYIISQAGERGMAWMGANVFSHQKTHPLIIKLNGADVLMGNVYTPLTDEEINAKHEDRIYNDKAETMAITTVSVAVAAVFALAAAVVCFVTKKNKED